MTTTMCCRPQLHHSTLLKRLLWSGILWMWMLVLWIPTAHADESCTAEAPCTLIKFTATTSDTERDSLIAQVDGQLVRWIAPLHTALVKLDLASLQSLTEVVLAADAETPVLSVEVDGMVTAIPILVETLTYDSDLAGQSTIPANPIQVDDPDFNNAQRVYAPGLLELTWAWRYTMGAPEIILAVIDSGVNAQHPDLSGRLLAGYDFVNNDNDPQDDHGHGTHIAGIIAAVANNG
jgi:thermitase